MRLYLFQSGTVRTFKHLLVGSYAPGIPYEVPVPFFLITHPRGNVLFDTGQPLATADHISIETDRVPDYQAVMPKAEYVVPQLAKIGLAPADIAHVVVSHLHADHAGGLGEFSKSTCHLQRTEAQSRAFAAVKDLSWHFADGDLDLFGDGRLRLIFTPGHTPGHQSLLVSLAGAGPILLTADSVYTEETLNDGRLPEVNADQESATRTLRQIQTLRREGVRVITGHDPNAWPGLNLAPEYYD